MIKTPAPRNSNYKRNVLRKEAAPKPPVQKRDNTFSKSRDTREDRGSRQMKNSHSPQTFPHSR
jgi:hypothetical protein